MLSMIVYYHCENGMRSAFVKALEENQIAQRCRQEPGNIQYDYFLSLSCPNTVLLLERWESEADQKQHLKTTNFEILSELKKNFVVSTDIERLRFF